MHTHLRPDTLQGGGDFLTTAFLPKGSANQPVVSPSSSKSAADRKRPSQQNRLSLALMDYDGAIDFDTWLNMHDTTWTKTKFVRRILRSTPSLANSYLTQIGFPANPFMAGLLSGKLTSMKAIMSLRQLYSFRGSDPSSLASVLISHVRHFNQYVHLDSNNKTLVQHIIEFLPISETLEEFQIHLFAAYLPINNYVLTRKIFKSRVKEMLHHDFAGLLQKKELDVDFALGYLLGILSRLYCMDLHHIHAKETFLNSLRKVIRLYQKMAVADHYFITFTLPHIIPGILARRPVRIEPLYALYTIKMIYHQAMQDTSFRDMLAYLETLEETYRIRIHFRPVRLAEIYQAMPLFDLAWGMKELGSVVMVECVD
jgi:hypothetical protein